MRCRESLREGIDVLSDKLCLVGRCCICKGIELLLFWPIVLLLLVPFVGFLCWICWF